jgi:hypothetical protein
LEGESWLEVLGPSSRGRRGEERKERHGEGSSESGEWEREVAGGRELEVEGRGKEREE